MQEFITIQMAHVFTLSVVFQNTIVFLLSFIESLPIITIVFPGSLIAVIVGTFTDSQSFSIFWFINMIALGNFLGECVSLYIGPKLLRFKWFSRLVKSEANEVVWKVFEKHIIAVIIFSKVLPFVRSAPSLFVGARGINKTKYLFYTLIGSYLWACIGIYGGNYMSKQFGSWAIPIIVGVFFVISILGYVYKKINH